MNAHTQVIQLRSPLCCNGGAILMDTEVALLLQDTSHKKDLHHVNKQTLLCCMTWRLLISRPFGM